MSPRRLLLVLQSDLIHQIRRPLFWIWISLLALFAWLLSTGIAQIQSGDSSVGGLKAHMTSEFAIAQNLTAIIALLYGFFIAVAAGMTVIFDEECRIGEIFHATSLRPSEYIWGKFLAVLMCIVIVLAVHISVLILFHHVLYSGSGQEYRGAFHLMNYLRPVLIFALPTAIFLAGASFLLGEWSRKPILIYFIPVAVFLVCNFFLWEYSPSWLTPTMDHALMLIDPAGLRWLSETYLKVDRGVAFYNSETIPLDGVIIANRLIFLALGFGAVAVSQFHFRSTLRGESRRAVRAWKRQQTLGITPSTPGNLEPPSSRSLGPLGMKGGSPGFLASAFTVMRIEIAELFSSPGLYLFIPLLVLFLTLSNTINPGWLDTTTLLTSGSISVRIFNALTTLLCLLLLFYTVESLWRERHTRLSAISFATPVRTSAILTGKLLANAFVGFVVIVLLSLSSIGWLLYTWQVEVEFYPFILVWGCLLIPTLLLWSSFVMATLALTRNRYTTYAIAILALAFTTYRSFSGKMTWVDNWPLWSALNWSDISVFEFDRKALILNRLMVIGLAMVFTALTAKLYARRELDAAGIAQRIQPWPLFRSALWLLPVATLPLVSGCLLWRAVDTGFQGEANKKLAKDYWRKNLSTYLDWPVPDISNVDIKAELKPAKGWFKVDGTYDVINNHDKPIRAIPVSGALHWENVKWTLNGKKFDPENRSHLYIFVLKEPLPPGGKLQIGFSHDGYFPDGISKRGGGPGMEFIVPSGVVLASFGTSFAPALGFSPDMGVDEENRYEAKEYDDDYYVGQTASFTGSVRPYTTKVTITGPSDFTFNSVGVQKSDDVKDGLRTTVWESDQPVNFYNIVAGRWDVKKGNSTAVYYNRKHDYNIDEMVEALNAARKYYSEWFFPYPWKELKLSEFPSLASYAQGFPTDITFSESIGFLTKSEPGSNLPFMVTAHESAHQWWGNIVAPGKGPGGNILSEGTSHFSTMLLFEQVKGTYSREEFARKIEDTYAKTRSADSERALVKTDGSRTGDTTVTYDKGGWVFWMLMQEMGRDRMLAGIKEFFAVYHSNPDHPVLQDFLTILRKHAADPDAFDAFTKQWFYQVVVPEYQIKDAKMTEEKGKWVVKATVINLGTGRFPVEIAATNGERYKEIKKGEEKREREPSPEFKESRTKVTLSHDQSKEVTITCDFKPTLILADPDVKLLQLRRKAASVKL